MFEQDRKSIENKHTLPPQRRLIITDTEGFAMALGEDHKNTDTFCNHGCSLTRNTWYNTTSRIVYSKSRVKNFAFLKILNMAVFALGFFTDFEILNVFHRTGLFLSKSNRQISDFFCRKSLA